MDLLQGSGACTPIPVVLNGLDDEDEVVVARCNVATRTGFSALASAARAAVPYVASSMRTLQELATSESLSPAYIPKSVALNLCTV